MSLAGLSSDVELAIETMVNVLAFPIDIEIVEDDKMRAAMDSKIAGFKSTKETLNRWITSPNAPSNQKAIEYIERLVSVGEENIMLLRDALRKEIRLESLEAHKHAAALKSKAAMLQFIQDLDRELDDLRQQIIDGKIQLEERDFTLGYPERFARGDFFPESKYHKKW